MCHVHAVGCDSTLTRQETLTVAITPMNLGDIMLGKISQSQKRQILCDSPETRSPEQMHRDRKEKGRCQGPAETGTGS